MEHLYASSTHDTITLTGGSFDKIEAYPETTAAAYLAEGYAFQSTKGEKAMVSLSQVGKDITNVKVVKCENHSDGKNDTGTCDYCGAQIYKVKRTDKDGKKSSWCNTVAEAVNEGDGIIILLDDVNETSVMNYYENTLDLNGHHYEGTITVCLDTQWSDCGTLTVKDSKTGGKLDKISAGSAKLTVESGEIGTLDIQTKMENLSLKGGTYGTIKRDIHQLPTFDKLLGEGYAFQNSSGLMKRGDVSDVMKKELTGVSVVECTDKTHKFESGKCVYCETPCNHPGCDADNVCTGCGLSMVATAGDKCYATLADALKAVAEDGTVTLLGNVELGETAATVTKTCKIDLNGKSITGEIVVDSDGALVLYDESESGGGKIGTLTANGNLTVYGGEITTLNINKSANLAGGKFGTIALGLNATATDTARLLSGGYAYRKTDGTMVKRGELANRSLAGVEVVRCTHADNGGTCDYCGVNSYTVSIGEAKYFDLNAAYAAAKSGDTLTLLANAVYFDDGSDDAIWGKDFTLDLAGKTLTIRDRDGNCPILVSGNVTITNSGTTTEMDIQSGINVDENATLTPSGKLTLPAEVDDAETHLTLRDKATLKVVGSNVTVGYLKVEGSTSTQLTCGTFNTVKMARGTLLDILKDGYRFYTPLAGTIPAYWSWDKKELTAQSTVAQYPIHVTSITTDPDKTTLTFGESVTLTANITTTQTGTASYQWYAVKDGKKTELTGQTGQTLELTNLAGGTHTYRVKAALKVGPVTYTALDKDITFRVAKATLTESDYTAPQGLSGLTFRNAAQALSDAGTAPAGAKFRFRLDDGEWQDTPPQATDAGTYTVSWYLAGGENYEDVGSEEAPKGSFEVVVAPMELRVTSVTVPDKVFDGLTGIASEWITTAEFYAGASQYTALKAGEWHVNADFQ